MLPELGEVRQDLVELVLPDDLDSALERGGPALSAKVVDGDIRRRFHFQPAEIPVANHESLVIGVELLRGLLHLLQGSETEELRSVEEPGKRMVEELDLPKGPVVPDPDEVDLRIPELHDDVVVPGGQLEHVGVALLEEVPEPVNRSEMPILPRVVVLERDPVVPFLGVRDGHLEEVPEGLSDESDLVLDRGLVRVDRSVC